MLAVMPRARKGTNEMRTETGMVMTGMSALGRCQRKRMMMRTTVTMTPMRVEVSVSMERWMSSERS